MAYTVTITLADLEIIPDEVIDLSGERIEYNLVANLISSIAGGVNGASGLVEVNDGSTSTFTVLSTS